MKSLILSRPVKALLFVVLAVVLSASLVNVWGNYQQEAFSSIWFSSNFEAMMEGKARIRTGETKAEVISASPVQPASVPAAAPGGFTPQTRLGFTSGDQWEPAIAADRFGHVYVLYAQYGGVPGCVTCSNPTQVLQISNDRGTTWGSPFVIHPAGASTGGQWDSQI
ncbi:MAG TPA: hypothetical protein VFY83_06555, partial [Anaerolineales bacterium]|nr:hypothetical protein [Anaerolineales bacterium]